MKETFHSCHSKDNKHQTEKLLNYVKTGQRDEFSKALYSWLDTIKNLVLRNNLTTAEHPLGVYHPHEDKHHIKKENIGLIEVMGLAVLPARLDKELADLKEAILNGSDIRADETLAKHADWVDELKKTYTFTEENTEEILQQETGKVFMQVLEDAGVYKRNAEGKAAFLRFADAVNQEEQK